MRPAGKSASFATDFEVVSLQKSLHLPGLRSCGTRCGKSPAEIQTRLALPGAAIPPGMALQGEYRRSLRGSQKKTVSLEIRVDQQHETSLGPIASSRDRFMEEEVFSI